MGGGGGRLRLGVRVFTGELRRAASQEDRPGALSSKKVSPPGGFLRPGREKPPTPPAWRKTFKAGSENPGLRHGGFTCPAGRDGEGGTETLKTTSVMLFSKQML